MYGKYTAPIDATRFLFWFHSTITVSCAEQLFKTPPRCEYDETCAGRVVLCGII